MTKKDFELIARVLNYRRWQAANTADKDQVMATAQAFALALAADNPRFDSARFLMAVCKDA